MSAALLRTIRAGSSDFLRRAAGLSATCAFVTLLAAPAQAAQLTLAWDPSPSTSVTGYYVHVGTAPGTTDQRIVATGLNATITGLNQGKTYYFSVSAHDAAGTESPRSNEVKRVLPSGDFNYNGTADILWRHATSGLNEIWTMNGATRVATVSLPAVAAGSEIAATADFNGDGTADVLWRASDGSNTVWLISNGTRTAAAIPAMTDSNWKVAGAGDFNGDGKADILWRNGSTGANTIWLMDGLTRTETLSVPTIAPTLGWRIGAVGDSNGDGKVDIFWRHTGGSNHLWLMNGAKVTTSTPLAFLDAAWEVLRAADFDADGKGDLLWHHATSGASQLWLMDGTTRRRVLAVPAVTPGWKLAALADTNGDGKTDLVWRHSGGSNHLWLMNGASVTTSTPLPFLDPKWGVVAQ